MQRRTTLLALVHELDADLDAVIAMLDEGAVALTGNFRGREREIVQQIRSGATPAATGIDG